MLSIGLMSGTSMDGIDAALLGTDGSAQHLEELAYTSLNYSLSCKILFKAAEYSVRVHHGDVKQAQQFFATDLNNYLCKELGVLPQDLAMRIAELAQYLYQEETHPIYFSDIIHHSTQLHVKAVRQLLAQTQLGANEIDVIGYHGQTLFHQPEQGISIIVGDGQALADELGITVINDFRAHDIANGGQGAPFAPIYHQALAVRDQKLPLAVVNCGGIANVTFIQNSSELDLVGFDTGPGNALIDRLIRQRTMGQENMDNFGKYGSKGSIDSQVFAALYAKALVKNEQNYFDRKPPKSLDYGDLQLIPELQRLSLEDACRTLEAFTADTIVHSLKWCKGEIPKHWILAGGGWKNPVIYQELLQRLLAVVGPQLQLETADEAMWNSQALEAQIFAYFAVRSLQNQPLSVPGTTHVAHAVSGGKAYLPKTGATAEVAHWIKTNPAVLQGYHIR